MNINSYESYATQVQFLLKQVNDNIKGLSKKDAIKMLEFALKFPVEHDEIDIKLTKPEHKEIKDFIIKLETAKSSMTITFLMENGQEIQQHQQQKKVNKETEEKKEDIKPQIKVVEEILGRGLDEECEDCGCEVKCIDCTCQGEE